MGKAESRKHERERAFQVLYGLNYVPAATERELAAMFGESPAFLAELPTPVSAEDAAANEIADIIDRIERRSGSGAQAIDAAVIQGLRQGRTVTYADLAKWRSTVDSHISSLNAVLAEKGCGYKLAISPSRPLRLVALQSTGSKKKAPVRTTPVPTPKGFSWDLASGVWSKQEELDQIIAKLSQHWRIERIGRIELTILRLALFEILHRPDVPVKVAINEAIELAKQFGDENSRGFVNGILDAAAKALENGEIGVH